MTTNQHGLLALLHRANQMATERFAEATGQSGLTPRQVHVLSAIAAHDGASQTDLVNATGIDRSTMADIVRRLLRRQLIERRRTRNDARAYAVKLTDAGRRELARGQPLLDSVERNMLTKLPAKERQQLLGLLGTFVSR